MAEKCWGSEPFTNCRNECLGFHTFFVEGLAIPVTITNTRITMSAGTASMEMLRVPANMAAFGSRAQKECPRLQRKTSSGCGACDLKGETGPKKDCSGSM